MLISNISEKTELLQFDYCSGFFDLLLHLFGFFLCYAFFDGLGCAVNEFLSFFESEAGDFAVVLERYPNAMAGDFDGDPRKISEMDALIAYLQVLGRMVDFSTYRAEENLR